MSAYERQEEERKAKRKAKDKGMDTSTPSKAWARPTGGGQAVAKWSGSDATDCGLAGVVASLMAADCLVSQALTRSKSGLRLTVITGAVKEVLYLNAGEAQRNREELDAVRQWCYELSAYCVDTDRRLSDA